MSSIIIKDVAIITVSQGGDTPSFVERGVIRIDGDRITAVGRCKNLNADTVIDGSGMLAMPGLLNGHNHFEQTFMAGVVRLFPGTTADWIQNFKIPMTLRMEAEDYYYSAMLAAVQMIKSGVTCSVNHICQQSADRLLRFGINEAFRAVGESGIRCLAPIGLAGKNEPDEFIVSAARFEELLEAWHEQGDGSFNGRLRVWAGPTGFYSSTEPMWEVAKRFAAKHNGGIHTHLATFERGDVDQAEAVGVLGERFVGAHSVWLDAHDVRRLGESQSCIVHNPTYKLGYSVDSDVTGFGDGIAPIADLCAGGCMVGLGQDGCMGDTQDMFKEMRMLAYTQHYRYRDKEIFPPSKLIEMATIDSARTMRWSDEIGSLEPGKKADLILLDVRDPKFTPWLNIPANIVYQANAENVDTVIIDGEIVMRQRKITRFDERVVLEGAQRAATSLLERSGLGHLATAGFIPWGTHHDGTGVAGTVPAETKR
ncbi:MAG: hypothetical protein EA403_01920 [Spirochaetaceae bacterium]|nr:MAG: hypothetical protein EA403_01920 [Spirochaetaceae bacterium]